MVRFRFVALVLLFLPLLAVAQLSETRSIGSFSGIKTGEAIDVYLKKGDKESVRVEMTGDQLRNIITEVVGSYLKIHRRDNSIFRNNVDVKVYVTYVSIDRIYASSAANVFSDGPIKAESMEFHASSAADIELTIEASRVAVHASSAADVILEGTAKSIDAEASSSGEVDAYRLQVETAKASASSAGSIKLSVSQELVAGASSGGSVRYRGNPTRTNTHSSSGGSVKKAN